MLSADVYKRQIPVFAFELKNQFTGQTVENAKQQWMHDRDPREVLSLIHI